MIESNLAESCSACCEGNIDLPESPGSSQLSWLDSSVCARALQQSAKAALFARRHGNCCCLSL